MPIHSVETPKSQMLNAKLIYSEFTIRMANIVMHFRFKSRLLNKQLIKVLALATHIHISKNVDT